MGEGQERTESDGHLSGRFRVSPAPEKLDPVGPLVLIGMLGEHVLESAPDRIRDRPEDP